jgi:hypothetical protein
MEVPKIHDLLRVLKQTVSLSIIKTRKEHGLVGRYLKIDSTSILFKKLGFPERERITTKQCYSHPRESILIANDCIHCCEALSLQCHSYSTACGPRSDCVHEVTLLD